MTANLESIYAKAEKVNPLLETIYVQAAPKFGCLMAMVPSLDAELPNFAAMLIKNEDLTGDGIELEPHVTVLYGFKLNFDSSKLEEFSKPYFPINAKIGAISRFECAEYDVVKFEIESPELENLNAAIAEEFSDCINPSEYDYNPHMTIAYVRKGSALNRIKNTISGRRIKFNSLLYSLPEKKGRVLIQASDHSSLASRIEALLVKADDESWKQIHDTARDHAASLYQHAVDRTVNYAEAKAHQDLEAKKRKENTQDAINVIFFSLIEEAEQEAYRAATATLATAEPALEGVQTHPEHEEVADFQAERRPLLEAFPADLHEKLLGVVHDGIAAGQTDSEIRARIALEASTWRKGRGANLAQTEAQATYGGAQARLLKKAGFKTAIWNTEDDDKVRKSHRHQDGMEQEIGKPFPNGCRWPGDESAEAGESINCRCFLTSGRRSK